MKNHYFLKYLKSIAKDEIEHWLRSIVIYGSLSGVIIGLVGSYFNSWFWAMVGLTIFGASASSWLWISIIEIIIDDYRYFKAKEKETEAQK